MLHTHKGLLGEMHSGHHVLLGDKGCCSSFLAHRVLTKPSVGQWQSEVRQQLTARDAGRGLAPQSVLGQGLFPVQNLKMHSTSCMFLRTQTQGRMNTCEAE